MAKRNATISSLTAGLESNAKNHEWCIADAKRLKVAKHGKASVTDTEGDAIRFLDASTFRSIAKQYEAKSRERASHERCAVYLTALEYLAKAGVIA